MRFLALFIIWTSIILVLSGCGSVKLAQLTMFDNLEEKLTGFDSIPALVIMPDDILSIQVTSRNPETVRAFERRAELRSASGERALGIQEGYRVDEKGMVYLPFLGQVHAATKSINHFREQITDSLERFIPDVTVQVRFVNFRVTLLGEINRPNTYTIPNERLNLLEAIGMAGDYTAYAKRDSVLIIRQRSNTREFARVNTQSEDLFNSKYFHLLPNDIIYVEPLKAKQYATEGDFIERYSRVLIPVVSLLTFFIGATFVK